MKVKDRTSLADQIDELSSECLRRRGLYPRLVCIGEMNQEMMCVKIERLESALNTLVWLSKNVEDVKLWVAMSIKFRGHDGRDDVNETIMDAPPDVLPSLDELTWEEVVDEGGEEKGPEEEAAE